MLEVAAACFNSLWMGIPNRVQLALARTIGSRVFGRRGVGTPWVARRLPWIRRAAGLPVPLYRGHADLARPVWRLAPRAGLFRRFGSFAGPPALCGMAPP